MTNPHDVRRVDASLYAGHQPAPSASPVFQPQPQQPIPPVAAFAAAPSPATAASVPAVAATQNDAALAENEVILSRVYRAHDKETNRIRFREPLTRDIRKVGMPFRFVTDEAGLIAEVVTDYDKLANMIVLTADPPLPPSTVDQFPFADLETCAAALVRFFVRLRTR